jgi:hypothetical protein
VISKLGERYLLQQEGKLTARKQIWASADAAVKANRFQAHAKSRHEQFEIADIVDIWANAIDYDTFRVLRGVGVELGYRPDHAAQAAIRALVQTLSLDPGPDGVPPAYPPGPQRDVLLQRAFGG